MSERGGETEERVVMENAERSTQDHRLTEWMGYSDVFCGGMEEIAMQLDRIADITERQANESFDHLEEVVNLTGVGRLFCGAVPVTDRERLIEQNLQALLAGYVRADYLRQALNAMASLLRGYASEANAMAAQTIAEDPSLRSTALSVAERFREMHQEVGMSDLRRRMLGRLNGLEIVEESDDRWSNDRQAGAVS